MQKISKDQYINNPCASLPTAYWKSIEYPIPKNIKILHEREFDGSDGATKYFRLLHNLINIESCTNDDFEFRNVNIETQKDTVAQILSECYDCKYSVDFVENMTGTRVFDNNLWIFLIEKKTLRPVALGIADFDKEISEGSLEWIQVLPGKRGLGLAKLLVTELLIRLKDKANFATVSGEVDNRTKPETVYRKCGFTGSDIWYVMRTE
ncbi:MAG: hypothetical protein FWG65_02080 [Turicibacter sp.]|nr:hypothetical protein [Turicibacter sp.]